MPKTILLVDDDTRFLSRLRQWLDNAGPRTLLADDGQKAIAVLEQYHQEIDLVVLDLARPDGDGSRSSGFSAATRPASRSSALRAYSETSFCTSPRKWVQTPR